MKDLPEHLQKYIVDQNYSRYTPLDQAVWRYTLRQLKKFLKTHAHEAYERGLSETGINTEQIPYIEDISAKIENFGWRALAVSGFIPPAAFMELQSLSILPIASDMRSIDHLLYTPAPDIVHEAAGHAPLLSHKPYADYLKKYAQVAKKAIISKQDLDVYEAIRELSDIKENPQSTPAQIAASEEKLKKANQNISHISEASELSRMNWWTAEYGMIGPIEDPKIFGAGLLSSIGESKQCLFDKVKKIPLSVDCIKQTYDITEPQPQLFVARDFQHLGEVLDDLAKTMAFSTGGISALQKVKLSQTVNTVELNSGLQISGLLKDYLVEDNKVIYLQFVGPTQLSYDSEQIPDHGPTYHKLGYGTPVGKIKSHSVDQLEGLVGRTINVEYDSGISVTGHLKNVHRLVKSNAAVQPFVLTFSQVICQKGTQIFFKPEWGDFDIVSGDTVTSCYAGPADRKNFGLVDDFVAARIPTPKYTDEQKRRFYHYQAVRTFRISENNTEANFQELFLKLSNEAPKEWLLFLELYEISVQRNYNANFKKMIAYHLEKMKEQSTELKNLIDDGLAIAHIQR